RKTALACAVLLWAGAGAAQPPPELQQAMTQARIITQSLGDMLLGERLDEPTRMRDLAEVMNLLTFALRDMAVYAEYGTLTDAQRAQLSATLEKAQLMTQQLAQQIRAERLQQR
ncbi:MAG: hypothetical protein AB7U81_08535, partial [Thiohalomonadaceae bacterium]